jgi:hypothetical protein
MAGPLDFLLGGNPDPGVQAQALERLMRMRQAGMLNQFSGDKVLAPIGQRQMTGAGQQEEALAQAANQAAGRLFQQRQFERQQKADESRLGIEKARLRIDQGKMEQDAFGAIADPITGEVILYNKKTGQRVSSGGTAPGPRGGTGGLKPQRFESDVQALGKDVEPLSKARGDIDALKAAAEKGDVAGFGPFAGRVPNVATSGEGLANRQAAGRLMAAIIQATSGQAASEKEVDRLLEANGMGRTATDEQLKLGIQKLDTQYKGLLGQREAKYLPQVVETYQQRGGFTSKGQGATGSEISKPPDMEALRRKYGL